MDTESAIYRILSRMVRVGLVSTVNPSDATVRVVFPDHDNAVSPPLKVLMRGSKATKDFWMPVVDDLVLCVFTANGGGKGAGAGYVIGTIYNTVDAPPSGGTRVLNVPDDLVINCGSLKVNAGGGDVTVNGISLVSHVHGGVSSGGSNTGKPQ